MILSFHPLFLNKQIYKPANAPVRTWFLSTQTLSFLHLLPSMLQLSYSWSHWIKLHIDITHSIYNNNRNTGRGAHREAYLNPTIWCCIKYERKGNSQKQDGLCWIYTSVIISKTSCFHMFCSLKMTWPQARQYRAKKNKKMEITQMHLMDPSASEESTLQSPLGTIIYQSLLPKPPERTALGRLPVLTFF